MNALTQIERARRNAKAKADPMAQLFNALAIARGQFPSIAKTRVATVRSEKANYSYRYADLSDILNAVDPCLADEGLAIIQEVDGKELVTTLTHRSGQKVQSRFPLIVPGGKGHPMQELQKAVTFARRYALTALLGIATEESIEGTDSRRVAAPSSEIGFDEKFDGPDGSVGVKGVAVPKGATPARVAELYGDGIIKLMQEAKTITGVNGQWNRHQKFIDRFATSYPDVYANVFDAFQACIEGFSEEDGVE